MDWENYGVGVSKEQSHKSKRPEWDIKNKGDYNSGDKRPFERRSGTGKPAFSN